MVDPTGLKPAPHGLKGRRSVTRAPGQKIGCGGRIRTFDGRINNPAPYQLGYATRSRDEGGGMRDESDRHSFYAKCFSSLIPHPFKLEAMKGVEPLSSGLQDRRSVIRLSYIADENLVDWEGFKPSQEVCRTSMLSLHHQPEDFGGCGWSRTTNLALMRRLL